MIFPNEYRSPHPFGWPHKPGDPFGWFFVPHNGQKFVIQADAQTEWEHVSISMIGVNRTPKWSEMCFIKELFWSDDDTVVQFHPPKKDYVNVAKNCLHLWRFKGDMPRPPKKLV